MILVTGADGFVGYNLIKALKAPARALVFFGGRKVRGIEQIHGDINDAKILNRALKGVDCVVHLAGVIKEEKLFKKVNVDGTRSLVNACRRNRVKKIVFVSTYLAGKGYNDPYGRSKREAERIIQDSGMKYIILRSTLMYGKGDSKNLTQLAKMIRRLPIIPIIGDGNYKLQPVFVGDVVKVITKAISAKKWDKVYYVAGPEALTYNGLVDIIAKSLGKRRIKIHIPLALIKPAVKVCGVLMRNPILSEEQLSYLVKDNVFSISGIVGDLDVHPQHIKDKIESVLT